MSAPAYHRRNWPEQSATGEWVREDVPGQRAPARTVTGEITGEWPTGMWERRAVPAPAESPAATGTAGAGVPRLLAGVRPDGRPVSLGEHRATYGPLRTAGAGRLIAESGLRGRGGAGFPVEAKVQAVRLAGGKPVVVVNGAAGDPLGEKDTFLVSRLPHLILDGAQVAADAVEARQILVSIVDRPGVYDAMERAMAERRRARTDEAPMKLVAAPDRYVTGESSATAAHLSGNAALPTYHPPQTAERGVKGRPTLVQNVETHGQLRAAVPQRVGVVPAGRPSEPSPGRWC